MALLPILEFPDPRLRTKAVPVEAANVTTASVSPAGIVTEVLSTV